MQSKMLIKKQEQSTDKTNNPVNNNHMSKPAAKKKNVRTTDCVKLWQLMLNDPDSITSEEFLFLQSVIGYQQAVKIRQEAKLRKKQRKLGQANVTTKPLILQHHEDKVIQKVVAGKIKLYAPITGVETEINVSDAETIKYLRSQGYSESPPKKDEEGTGKSGGYKFSVKGEELLKQIELPSSENYNGKSYYVYDNDGKLIGIRCQDVGDGGVTIGYGSYTSWSDTEKIKKLKSKYGITAGMSAKELFNIVVPINDSMEMMREEINSKTEKLINNVIKPNGIKLTQQQFDALLIHRYMVGSFNDGLVDYLKDSNGNYKRDKLTGVMLDYLKGLKSWDKYGKGWTKRIDNEMNIFFNGDYKKTF